MKILLQAVILIWFLCLPLGCSAEKEVVYTGRTMGTTYHIKVVAGFFERLSGLQDNIDARLQAINQSMSTYLHDSEISRFNRSTAVGAPFQVGVDFFRVFEKAQQIYTLSGGAWDGTVKPLVDLWGFGNREQGAALPNADAIAAELEKVGFHHIRALQKGALQKRLAAITLDFASIAKGYAVDQVAALLMADGREDFIVEIGGEVFAAGVRKDGGKWRVGVNVPDRDASLQDLYSVVQLSGLAMATSGDYRNFIELDGNMYSHIIDPRTGYPVRNKVASATVTAPDCTMADGLATAIAVMGRESGLALIEALPGVEGLIIVRETDGAFRGFPSSGFAAFSE